MGDGRTYGARSHVRDSNYCARVRKPIGRIERKPLWDSMLRENHSDEIVVLEI